MRKTILIMVLSILCLSVQTGIAESLTTRLDVPDHIVEEPYQTSTGFTTITIDATIEMPDISAVSTYEVAPRTIDEAEIKVISDAFGFNVKNVVLEEDRDESQWTYQNFFTRTFKAHNKTHDIYFINDFVKDAPAGAYVQVSPKGGTRGVLGHGQYVSLYPLFLWPADLTQTAKLLYALLLDRTTLSQKNGWMDECGHIYVIFTLGGLSDAINRGLTATKDALNELETADLIERKRRGFCAPNRIFVKLPPLSRKTDHHTAGNPTF